MGVLSPIRQGAEAERLSPWGQKPGRLWSLWDMLELNAAEFIEVTTQLADMSAYVEARADTDGSFVAKDVKLSETDRKFIGAKLKRLLRHASIIGAPVTILAIAEFEEAIASDTAVWGTLPKWVEDVTKTLRRELTSATVLVIEPTKRDFYSQTIPLFGTEVSEKFKEASFEISEAGKCLSLSRSTACVFHLMRVMEIGVRAVARHLGVPDPIKPGDRNWGYILKAIKSGIEKRWPNASDCLGQDYLALDALFASLDAVKNPFRNATMHVENIYTEDEAEHILLVVKGFMKKLACQMDEQGEPKA